MDRPIIVKHLYTIGAYTHTNVGRLYRHILIQVKNQVVETELGTEICGTDLILHWFNFLFILLFTKNRCLPNLKKKGVQISFSGLKKVWFF